MNKEELPMVGVTVGALPDALKQGVLYATLEPPGALSVTNEALVCPRCNMGHVLFMVHRGEQLGSLVYHCLPCSGRSGNVLPPCSACQADSRRRE